jgi:superfamily I DNA/RNA helicase
MAERKFELPKYSDLSKEQDAILALPKEGQYLIIGAPGTGKSVVALLRAKKLHSDGGYEFLTYNKVLNEAIKQMIDGSIEASTLTSFLYKTYFTEFRQYVPEIEKYKPNYEQVIKDFREKKQEHSLRLIIDEGQDMPPEYYQSLIAYGIENFFIVADQNQQITEDHSSRQDLTDLLALNNEQVIELTQNYRNSHSIALFAQYFYTDKASPKPKLPSEKKEFGKPILYTYRNFKRCINYILGEADRDPRNLIGVVVDNDEVLEICRARLSQSTIELDNPKPNIQYYQSDKSNEDKSYAEEDENKEFGLVDIDFSEGGIVVLNAASVKGLEFDIVFVMLNGFQSFNDTSEVLDQMRKKFYVISSRAIKKLVFFQSSTSDIDKILPASDDPILLRKELANA